MAVKHFITGGLGLSPGTLKWLITDGLLPGDMPAPSTAVWEFHFDFDADHALDAGDDISSYVKRANWQLGFASPAERIARESTLELTLRNSDKRFSPENAASPHYPNFTLGRSIRVQCTFNGNTYSMILTESGPIKPVPNTKGARETMLTSVDFLGKAQRAEVNIPVLENVTADVALRQILLATEIYPPSFDGRWRLGKIGAAELGVNTVLGTLADLLAEADVGQSVLPFVGDNWNETSMYAAMEELAGREYGRIFLNRDGALVFWNRDRPLEKTTPDFTLSDADIADYVYSFGDQIINYAVATATPRKVGAAADDVLGVLDKAVKLRSGETKEIIIRYKSTAEGVDIGGKNAIEPARTTDWQINSLEDGSGEDWTESQVFVAGNLVYRVTADLVEESATRSVVAWTNNGVEDVWLQAGAQVRGQKITTFSAVAMESLDSDSIKAYGRFPFSYGYPLDDVDLAAGIASFTVRRLKSPVGTAKQITLQAHKSADILEKCLTYTIGNMVRITESQTGSTADYFIIGEAWEWSIKEWMCTWFLEPAQHAQADYWLLGVVGRSELGQKTYLGPF